MNIKIIELVKNFATDETNGGGGKVTIRAQHFHMALSYPLLPYTFTYIRAMTSGCTFLPASLGVVLAWVARQSTAVTALSVHLAVHAFRVCKHNM